jgi:hypothetical protein
VSAVVVHCNAAPWMLGARRAAERHAAARNVASLSY